MAAITRTSTRRVCEEPTRSSSPRSSTRSSLAWSGERQVADFVEEEGAAVGRFEAAHAVGLGVGKSAAHVAEKLAFESAVGQAADVDGDQRLAGARRSGVQGARHQAFAAAVFAGEQHGGVARRHPADQLEHRPHGRRLGHQQLGLLARRPALRRGEAARAP